MSQQREPMPHMSRILLRWRVPALIALIVLRHAGTYAFAQDGAEQSTVIRGRILYDPPLQHGIGLRENALDLAGKRTKLTPDQGVTEEEFKEVRKVAISADGSFVLRIQGVTSVRFVRELRPVAGSIEIPYIGEQQVFADGKQEELIFDVVLKRVEVAKVKVLAKDKRTNDVLQGRQIVLEAKGLDNRSGFRGVAGGLPDETGAIIFSVPRPGDETYQVAIRTIPETLRGARSEAFGRDNWPTRLEIWAESLVPVINCKLLTDDVVPTNVGYLQLAPSGIKSGIRREGICTFYNIPPGKYQIVVYDNESVRARFVVDPPCSVEVPEDAKDPVEVVVHVRRRPTAAALHVQADAPASESPDAQARRNRELAVRPFVFAACITAGAVLGMLLMARWRKRKLSHGNPQ